MFAALATGCNDKTNPAGPSPPAAPTVTNLDISGADAVRTGLSTNYTVTATLSDGTTRAVTPTWTSSNPGVASVDSAGRLVGLAHGATNLTASHESRSESKTVQVVSNYEGSWVGRYVISACDDSGDLRDRDGGWCRGPGRVGSVYPISLTLSQTGSNQSEVRGTLTLPKSVTFTELEQPYVSVDVTGVVTADGRLNLGGTLTTETPYCFPSPYRKFSGPSCGLARLQVGAWDTNLGGPSVMMGRWSQNLVALIGLVGNGNTYTENELVTMTQNSTSATSASVSQ